MNPTIEIIKQKFKQTDNDCTAANIRIFCLDILDMADNDKTLSHGVISLLEADIKPIMNRDWQPDDSWRK